MSNQIKYFILFLACWVVNRTNAQDSGPDCVNPQLITILQEQFCDSAEERFYFTENDQFTFWYQIDFKTDRTIELNLEPLDSTDHYDMVIYPSTGIDRFCNAMVRGQVKPFNLKERTIKGKKGESYHVGVLHLGEVGCGHELTIESDKGECKYIALHEECIELIASRRIAPEPQPEPVFKALKARPEMIKLEEPVIKGKVINATTGKSLKAQINFVEKKSGDTYPILSYTDDGYVFEGEIGVTYEVTCELFGYKKYRKEITFDDYGEFNIEMIPFTVGERMVMRSIYFHPNTYALKDGSEEILYYLANFMKENPNVRIEIQGHTNGNRRVRRNKLYRNLGPEWNYTGSAKKLSQYRAEVLKEWLVKQGVEHDRIEPVGYGGDRMIIKDPKTMKQAMKNIRVEVHIIE